MANHSPKKHQAPIGFFDSGYGGLTVLDKVRQLLPSYDYIYLGDNARAPYGGYDLGTVYKYTREAVSYLFAEGCPLVILACNTASAQALRTLQLKDLPLSSDPTRRILGVIRPTVESIDKITKNNHIGIVGTRGTVLSNSYPLELAHMYGDKIRVSQQACPMWVPLVENGETAPSAGALYFIERGLSLLLHQDKQIDTILLGCTHYALLLPLIRSVLDPSITVVPQGDIVASSLQDYLHRHSEMECRLSHGGSVRYLTTGPAKDFASLADDFVSAHINDQMVTQVDLPRVSGLG